MTVKEIREKLSSLADEEYRIFQSKLIPERSPDSFVGVRTPELRKLAKEILPVSEEFLDDTPHKYFDEDQLHAFVLSEIKDFERCVKAVDAFLPYVDNWATCDQMSPKVFYRNREELRVWIDRWLGSDKVYTVRFAIGMIMSYFLGENYDGEYMSRVARIRSDEYYVNMMTAWYFATALAKNYAETLPYIAEGKLDTWTHNKSIQKATESLRISKETKDYLRTLKRKA